jgi:hypothetical protein
MSEPMLNVEKYETRLDKLEARHAELKAENAELREGVRQKMIALASKPNGGSIGKLIDIYMNLNLEGRGRVIDFANFTLSYQETEQNKATPFKMIITGDAETAKGDAE